MNTLAKKIGLIITTTLFCIILFNQSALAKPSTDIDHLLPTIDNDEIFDIWLDSPDVMANELDAVNSLPDVSSEQILATAVKKILAVSMLLTIIATVVAGLYYLISRGQEEDLTKSKNIILYLVIGIAIMAAAYGVISGVAQFKFFDEAPTTTSDGS